MIGGFDALWPLAEIAVALAGFSAIVVLFKRSGSGRWQARDADRFHGMLIHAMAAGGFCLLPSVLGAFVEAPGRVWSITSGLLGVQVVVHVVGVLRFATTTRHRDRLFVGLGLVVGAACLAAAVGLGLSAAGAVVLGIAWHLVQSGYLFVWLILIPAEKIDSPPA